MTRYFQHYKGGKYRLLAIGFDSENPSQKLVIYRALYGKHDVWVRPYELFFGKVLVDGKMVQRFSELSKEEAYDK